MSSYRGGFVEVLLTVQSDRKLGTAHNPDFGDCVFAEYYFPDEI